MAQLRLTRTLSALLVVAATLSAALVMACGDDNAAQESAVATPAVPSAAAAAGGTAAPSAAALRLLPLPAGDLGAPAVPPATTSTAAGAVPYAAALAPYAGFGTDAAPGVFPRAIRHAMGETTIKAQPQRVVVLDTGELDAMIEVGIRPVGAIDYSGAGLPEHFAGLIDGIKLVGPINEPDLEAIAALRPDLILSSKLRHEKLYERLAAIAPTVFTDRPGVSWKQNFVLYAQAAGREQAASATVARYEERVRQLNAGLPAPRPSVSIVHIRASDTIRYYQRANYLGVLLTDLGFPRPPAENVDDFSADLGLESIGRYAPADLIILAITPGQQPTFATAVLQSPLWTGIPAVKAGRVVNVDNRTWIGGIGYRAAFAVMDQLATYFGFK